VHLIKFDEQDFNSFLERTEAAYKADNEIIKDKLAKGVMGLEWLVMHVVVDDDRKESLEQWMRLAPSIAKGTQDPLDLFKSAVLLDHEAFYEKHELNWWIAIDEALSYFALLKDRDYNTYFKLLNVIYK
jgi:hypothetical protein